MEITLNAQFLSNDAHILQMRRGTLSCLHCIFYTTNSYFTLYIYRTATLLHVRLLYCYILHFVLFGITFKKIYW